MINVTKTYLPDIERYQSYVQKIFSSGWITNNGALVNKLEQRLKEYLGVKNIVLVTNGTIALQVAYKLLGLKGDVITTPFSFVATSSSIIWEGLTPVFVDIDSDTFNIAYNKIEEKLTSNTSCIVPVHVFGNGCEVEEIDNISRKYNIKVIYDAAHAFGVKYNDKSILNYGDISILSFHATKVFHTIEGGALVINDDELYKKAKKMINFGISSGQIECLGINAKMNEFQAAMGLCVLDDIDEIIEKRKNIFNYYVDSFTGCNGILMQTLNKNCTSNYGYFPILFESEDILIKAVNALNQKEIYPRRYFYPSLNNIEYINRDSMPISEGISKRILCLPLYDSIKIEEIDEIVNIIKMCIDY